MLELQSEDQDSRSGWPDGTRWLRGSFALATLAAALGGLGGCGPRAAVPPRPARIPPALVAGDEAAALARTLAPVLYLQRDEALPLLRTVAVVDGARRIIAYHLLWRDDVHAAWIPGTRPTDEEIVWVGYDASGAPSDVWTFWHKKILHAPWNRRAVEINVQWGKHGSLPRGVRESDLPRFRTLNAFYVAALIGLPDIWLGRLNRPGPWGFFHGYRRYRQFTRRVEVAPAIDVVLKAGPGVEDGMRRVFGWNYSQKRAWPYELPSLAR